MTSTFAIGAFDSGASTPAAPPAQVYQAHSLFFVVAGAIPTAGVDGWLWPVPVVYTALAAGGAARPARGVMWG
ncbi:MAG: hypothetical protein R3F65_31005 [bacterium]